MKLLLLWLIFMNNKINIAKEFRIFNFFFILYLTYKLKWWLAICNGTIYLYYILSVIKLIQEIAKLLEIFTKWKLRNKMRFGNNSQTLPVIII